MLLLSLLFMSLPSIVLRLLLILLYLLYPLSQRFSNFFKVGTIFISQNVLRTTLLLGLSNSLGLP